MWVNTFISGIQITAVAAILFMALSYKLDGRYIIKPKDANEKCVVHSEFVIYKENNEKLCLEKHKIVDDLKSEFKEVNSKLDNIMEHIIELTRKA